MRYLLTIDEAAEALSLSQTHIKKLIREADLSKRSRWKHGREIVDVTPMNSARRTLRININAVVPGLDLTPPAHPSQGSLPQG